MLGGYAVNFHGYHRNTADFDVWLAVDPDNAMRVSAALQEFGFSAASVPASRFAVRGAVHIFGREPWRVDLLTEPSGIDFEECYQRRVRAEIDGVPVNWISLQDLKVNKRASGRPKDIADVFELEKLAHDPAPPPSRDSETKP